MMMGAGESDLLGRPIEGAEADILDVYRRLRTLVGRDDLPPCAAANLRHALAYCWSTVSDLMLDYEHLLDVDV
ncbi:MAG: hypothetical protein ACRDN9_06430 [Streptosporangiaceae bacterium]